MPDITATVVLAENVRRYRTVMLTIPETERDRIAAAEEPGEALAEWLSANPRAILDTSDDFAELDDHEGADAYILEDEDRVFETR